MILRDDKFILPVTIGPNVDVNGLIQKANSGRAYVLKADALDLDTLMMRMNAAPLKENDAEE